MKLTAQQRLSKTMERVEETAMHLLYVAEHWSTTGATFYDLQRRRMDLLEAGRRYGNAVRALARLS